MKQKYLIPFRVPGVLTVLGCTKLTGTERQPDAGDLFQNPGRSGRLVAHFPGPGSSDGGYAFDFPMYSYFAGDDLTTDPQLGKGDQLSFDELNASSRERCAGKTAHGLPPARDRSMQ